MKIERVAFILSSFFLFSFMVSTARADEAKLEYSAFVDSYYNFDWNDPDVPQANGNVGHRAFARTHGFALSLAAFDATYGTDKASGTIGLIFGPTASRLIGGVGQELGLEYLKQAYVTFRPIANLAFDFGQFDTIYGAEVAPSFENLNYTRGALYFLMQPFWHQGLRMQAKLSETFGLNALVVNGVNEPFEGDRAPDLGIQLTIAAGDDFSAALGYYGSTKPKGKDFAHFGDLVLNWTRGKLDLVFNADVGVAKAPGNQRVYYGASLAGRCQFTEAFAAALRGEYLADPDGWTDFGDDALSTGTLTLEYVPAGLSNLIFRLDNRFEHSGEELFFKSDNKEPTEKTYMSTVFGVVVKTN